MASSSGENAPLGESVWQRMEREDTEALRGPAGLDAASKARRRARQVFVLLALTLILVGIATDRGPLLQVGLIWLGMSFMVPWMLKVEYRRRVRRRAREGRG